MEFRDDIIRGVRLAAIAFIVLLAGVIGYRLLHEAPSPPPSSPPALAGETAQPLPPMKPKLSDPPAVPPPPPSTIVGSGRKAPIHRAPIKKKATTAQPAPIVRNADSDTPSPQLAEIPMQAVAVPTELTTPESVPERVDGSATPQDLQGEKSSNRGTRALRAVGRFLHVGK
jgi:hypothetical protein